MHSDKPSPHFGHLWPDDDQTRDDSAKNLKRAIDRWHLEDVDEIQEQYSATFHVPSLDERRTLELGCLVRVHFVFDEPSSDGVLAERMWLRITDKHGDEFHGSLENHPIYVRTLSRGDSISFSVSHIAQILIQQTDPRWLDTTKKAIVAMRYLKRGVSVFYAARHGMIKRIAAG